MHSALLSWQSLQVHSGNDRVIITNTFFFVKYIYSFKNTGLQIQYTRHIIMRNHLQTKVKTDKKFIHESCLGTLSMFIFQPEYFLFLSPNLLGGWNLFDRFAEFVCLF